MSLYNRQQKEAIVMVRKRLAGLSPSDLRRLEEETAPYLEFRADAAAFQNKHFSGVCTYRCHAERSSDCCGREGILTFFADVVINILLSTDEEVDRLLSALEEDRGGFNCVYLGEGGCLWRLKPVVCEMFLCGHAKEEVLSGNDALKRRWEDLRKREELFTKPTRPVIFDDLERSFIEEGLESPLMYFHRSPGLVRLKARYGVGRGKS